MIQPPPCTSTTMGKSFFPLGTNNPVNGARVSLILDFREKWADFGTGSLSALHRLPISRSPAGNRLHRTALGQRRAISLQIGNSGIEVRVTLKDANMTTDDFSSEQVNDQPPARPRKKTLRDWNVVVSVREGCFNIVRKLLREYGPVASTAFSNVLVMQVADPKRLLADLAERASEQPEILGVLGRVLPVRSTFTFQSREDFMVKGKEATLAVVSELAGKSFYVRMHRHGFKGRISSAEQERFLGENLLEALEKAGTPGRVTFEDPDVIVVLVTLGNWAGLSVWTRKDRQRYPILHSD
jgi:tRNA(Ser,Leu) C12 N-acetylase TAN1